MPGDPRATRAWRRLVTWTLDHKGRTCWLRYPGICKTIATTADHIVPISQGGAPLDPSNLQPACGPCNRHKGDNPNPATDTNRQTRQWT